MAGAQLNVMSNVSWVTFLMGHWVMGQLTVGMCVKNVFAERFSGIVFGNA